jgi:acetyl-CoA carboxylase biotin carboxyl carrier protein
MDLSKIEMLIDFVGKSSITELTVTERDTTVRIFRTRPSSESSPRLDSSDAQAPEIVAPLAVTPIKTTTPVVAPIFGVLHLAPAPGEGSFVKLGDTVEAGQTLFIIEAMKVFNTIAAPRTGRIVSLIAIDGGEVEAGDMLAEIV